LGLSYGFEFLLRLALTLPKLSSHMTVLEIINQYGNQILLQENSFNPSHHDPHAARKKVPRKDGGFFLSLERSDWRLRETNEERCCSENL
jgi:hypothetical protein